MRDQTSIEPNPTKPSDSAPAQPNSQHESMVGEFLHSAVYSAIQQPLNGLTQLSDGLFGTNLESKVQMIAAPEQGNSTADKVTQDVGSAIGMLLPLHMVGKGVGAVFKDDARVGEAAGMMSRATPLGLSLREAAVTGFTYNALLQPSNFTPGDSATSVLTSRFLSGAEGAATFAALTASGIGIGKAADTGATKIAESTGALGSLLKPIIPVMRNEAAIGIAAGVPGGLINAEAGALQNGKALPDWSDVGRSITTMSIVGGALGAGSFLKSPHESGQTNYEYLKGKISENLNNARTSANDAVSGLADILTPKGGMFRPAFAMSSDARSPYMGAASAVLDTRSFSPTEQATNNGLDFTGGNTRFDQPSSAHASAEVVRSLFTRLKASEVVKNSSGQDYVFHQLSKTLIDLQRAGKVGSEWKLLATEEGSPADRVGADFYLVNTKTGAVHMMDATSNQEKFDAPLQHNVPALRQDGLVFFEPKWFDQGGALKVDKDEDIEIKAGVQGFRQDMTTQLINLTKEDSPFKLGVTPMPDIRVGEPAEMKQQIDNLVNWVGRNVRDPNVPEYISVVRRASSHLDIQMRKTGSPVFEQRVQDTSDRAVLNYAINKMLGKAPNPESSRGAVQFHAKTGEINLRAPDNSIVTGGNLIGEGGAIWNSRSRLISDDKLSKMLSEKQLANIKKDSRFAGKSDDYILGEIRRTILSSNELRNGGAVGTGKPVIAEAIANSLNTQKPENLLGLEKPQTPEQKAAARLAEQQAAEAQKAAETRSQLVQLLTNEWDDNGLPRGNPNELPDSETVQLSLMGLLDNPSMKPFETEITKFLEAYQENDPATVQAVNEALTTPRPNA